MPLEGRLIRHVLEIQNMTGKIPAYGMDGRSGPTLTYRKAAVDQTIPRALAEQIDEKYTVSLTKSA